MRWIRRNRRVGAWAALFALAVQITLSFGHIHLDKNILSSRTTTHTPQWQSAERGGPSSPAHHQNAADFCDICATIALVASSVLPEPATLTPPLATPGAWQRPFEMALSWRRAHNHFQARAPPFIA
jgi:hypothetical protein